jgi:hypothetical protein
VMRHGASSGRAHGRSWPGGNIARALFNLDPVVVCLCGTSSMPHAVQYDDATTGCAAAAVQYVCSPIAEAAACNLASMRLAQSREFPAIQASRCRREYMNRTGRARGDGADETKEPLTLPML